MVWINNMISCHLIQVLTLDIGRCKSFRISLFLPPFLIRVVRPLVVHHSEADI